MCPGFRNDQTHASKSASQTHNKSTYFLLFDLAGSFQESREATIRFPEIRGSQLEIAVCYFYYRTKYTPKKLGLAGEAPLPPYEPFRVPPEMALQMLMVANYLQC